MIEQRILYLLDFKKSVFTGVIEEEGKDEVMLEGFLESVRNLVEIDLDNTNTRVATVNSSYVEEKGELSEMTSPPETDGLRNHHDSDSKPSDAKTDLVEQHGSGIKKISSFFARIKGGLEKLLKSILVGKYK